MLPDLEVHNWHYKEAASRCVGFKNLEIKLYIT